MLEPFVNNGAPDQTPSYAASDLGLHCLPITLLGVFRLQWVNDAIGPYLQSFQMTRASTFSWLQFRNRNVRKRTFGQTCAPSKDSDQPSQSHSLIRIFTFGVFEIANE